MQTVTILYPGDMGGNVAKTLIGHKFNVVSYLKGRSEETKKNAARIGVEPLPAFASAVETDVVISLVPPNAVIPVAAQYIAAAAGTGDPARFVDMNAKSIAAANKLAAMFADAGIPFTNASIIGRASHVGDEGVIYTSGERPHEFDGAFERVFRVVYLGNEVAAATVFKMCFAGFNKTITAAIFEIAAAANRFGVTDRLFEQITEKMPGLTGDIGALTGNYPRHLSRRRQEMEELAKMLESVSLPNHIALAAAKTMAGIEERKNFEPYRDNPDTDFLTLMKALRV